MEDDEMEIRVPGKSNVKILKWKVKNESKISKGILLGLYEAEAGPSAGKTLRLKASNNAVVKSVEVEEGKSASPGDVLLKIRLCAAEPCTHPTIMKDMCAECGADLRSEFGLPGDLKESVKKITASVAMVHSIPELRVSEQEALEIGKEDENRLLGNKKLVLLVDLDQTLIHTTNDNIPANLKDVFHFQLRHGPGMMWYHTKLRPNTAHFLKTISTMFELHICTFGNRMYAHTIANFLDPDGRYFSHRILSRDECFDGSCKTANMKSLFPCGDSMVCIIDDREDVWENCPNLIHVKAYRFFQSTADINAPPGLTKTENDSIPLVHRVRCTSQTDVTNDNKDSDVTSDNKDSDVTSDNKDSDITSDNKDSDVTSDNKDSDVTSDNKDSDVTSDNKDSVTHDVDVKNKLDFKVKDSSVSMETSETEVTADYGKKSFEEGKIVSSSLSSVDDEKSVNANVCEISDSNVLQDETKAENVEDNKINVDNENKENADSEMVTTQTADVSMETDDNQITTESERKEERKEEITKDEDMKDEEMKDEEMKDEEMKEEEKEEECEKKDVQIKMDLENINEKTEQREIEKQKGEQKEIEVENVEGNLNKEILKEEKSNDKYSDETESKGVVVKENEDEKLNTKCSDETESKGVEGTVKDVEEKLNAKYSDETETKGVESTDKVNEDEIEWEDEDDYLWYLEEILTRIHKAYYDIYDQMKTKKTQSASLPSIKDVIAYVKRKVLKGVNIVFSGVVPLHKDPESSRIYLVAKSLGATVQTSLVPRTKNSRNEATTHLVAAKLGTIKVKQAEKMKGIHLVNPDWLWSISERWEKVDERLFPVRETSENSPNPETVKLSKQKKKAPHKRKVADNDTGENCNKLKRHKTDKEVTERDDVKNILKKEKKLSVDDVEKCSKIKKQKGKRKGNDAALKDDMDKSLERDKSMFANTYNPLFVFSDADIESMDKEVEDEMEESDSDEDDEERNERVRKRVLGDVSDSSDDSLSGDFPLGWKPKKPRSESPSGESEDESKEKSNTGYESENDVMIKYEGIVDAFGPHRSSESEHSDDSIGSVDDEIAEAVEKEFLAAL